MGRNVHSVCHYCSVQLMHLRGKESDNMQKFQNDHSEHEKHTQIISDYVEEPPDHYTDMFEKYNEVETPEERKARLSDMWPEVKKDKK